MTAAGQQIAQNRRGGGLAVGAGYPDDPHFLCGIIVEPGGQGRHGGRGILYPDQHHAGHSGHVLLHQNGSSPLGRSLANVGVAIGMHAF